MVDKVSELEAQTGQLQQQLSAQDAKLQEDEAAANDAISEWQIRCEELEAELQKANQIASQKLEQGSGHPIDEAKTAKDAKIQELELALSAANEAIENDEEIVRKWEGKNPPTAFLSLVNLLSLAQVDFLLCCVVSMICREDCFP